MEDVTPKLLKAIQEDFNRLTKSNTKFIELHKKISSNKATYKEANQYAIELGNILARAYQNNLSSEVLPNGKMYLNIAKKIIDPTMRRNFSLISKATTQVQKVLNEQAGIGLKAITPKLNEDKINGIIYKLTTEESFDDVKWVLDEPIVTFSQSIVDDSIKANAEFQSKAGLKPMIVRRMAGNCCDWCKQQVGMYIYPNVPEDVYRRHQRCKCTVEYIADGNIKVLPGAKVRRK